MSIRCNFECRTCHCSSNELWDRKGPVPTVCACCVAKHRAEFNADPADEVGNSTLACTLILIAILLLTFGAIGMAEKVSADAGVGLEPATPDSYDYGLDYDGAADK